MNNVDLFEIVSKGAKTNRLLLTGTVALWLFQIQKIYLFLRTL